MPEVVRSPRAEAEGLKRRGRRDRWISSFVERAGTTVVCVRAAVQSALTAMRDLHARTLALLTKAEASNDVHVALPAVREARGNLELLGRLNGSLDGPGTDQWPGVRPDNVRG